MQQPLTSADRKRVLGSRFDLDILDPVNGNPVRSETYRIGEQNNLQATPQILGIDSCWGEKLAALKKGDKTDLPVEEGNIITIKVRKITPPRTRTKR